MQLDNDLCSTGSVPFGCSYVPFYRKFYTSNNQRLEKCVRCVLLLYNWDLRVFLADHLL